MGTINATTAAMPHAHAATTGTAQAAHGAHGTHLEPKAPKSGDPRFLNGSTGEFGESKTVKQKDGPAYGGRKVAKNQNDNDRKQNNYGETDANFMRTLGVIADPDSGQPMSYAQSIQAYNAAGAIQELYPETYKKLVANQDAGRGTVLGGTLAIFGITQTDGFNGASLQGIDAAEIAKIRNAQLGNLGSLRDVVLDTRDFKGREWNRAHHPGSSWTAMKPLVEQSGFAWDEAALLTGDSMISWSGRVLGSNNQDGSSTGFAADELAGLKYMVLMEQATGKSALEHVLGGHAATHLPEDKLTDPKINKYIGLPKDFRPSTPEEIAMVAGRIRQWALQPGVQVDEGEFNKFVKAGMKTAGGQQLAASGLLNNVQFKPKQQNNGGGGGGNGGGTNDADVVPTGLGQGQLPSAGPMAAAPETTAAGADAQTALGGGDAAASIPLTGSTTIDTRPTVANLGVGGPFPVLDPETGRLNKALQEQLMTALLEIIYDTYDSPFLDDAEERSAFVDGAKKGARFLKDQVAASPDAVSELKGELAKALEDGVLSDAERASLSEKLAEAGMEDVAKAVEDGTVDEKELATLHEKIDGAASAKLESDLSAALEDGKLSAEERAGLEKRLGKEGLDALEKGIEDGTVTKEELEAIAKGAKADEAAKTEGAGTADAKDGAEKAGEGDAAKEPTAGADDAKAGAKTAEGETKAGDKPKADGETTADGESKPEGEQPAADAAAADGPPASPGEATADEGNAAPPVAA